MKHLLIISTWLTVVLVTLFTALVFFSVTNQTRLIDSVISNAGTSHSAVVAYAAIPTSVSQIENRVLGADARPVIIDAYLAEYNSPLVGHGQRLVEIADGYGVDAYMLVAIAQQESNLCKVIPDDSHNCWGWGIHSEGTLRFDSYEDAAEAVARGLKEEYLDKGYSDPELIMKKYTPMSNGSWAYGVNQFMEEMMSGEF